MEVDEYNRRTAPRPVNRMSFNWTAEGTDNACRLIQYQGKFFGFEPNDRIGDLYNLTDGKVMLVMPTQFLIGRVEKLGNPVLECATRHFKDAETDAVKSEVQVIRQCVEVIVFDGKPFPIGAAELDLAYQRGDPAGKYVDPKWFRKLHDSMKRFEQQPQRTSKKANIETPSMVPTSVNVADVM